MIVPFRKPRLESWATLHARMIRETEVFLEEGLREPEQHLRIPAIPVGSGSFPRGFSDVFWSQVLGSS
jgi:hypothetical protein